MTDSGSYSYSYSSSSSSSSEVSSAMWAQISRIPIDLLREAEDFVYIEKILSLVSKYDFTVDDPHMTVPESTVKIGRLLCLVAAQCSKKISAVSKEKDAAKAEAEEAEAFLRKKVELQNTELVRLRRLESSSGAGSGQAAERDKTGTDPSASERALLQQENELKQLRIENDLLSTELRKMTRANEEMKQSIGARRQEQTQAAGDADKQYLEYKHLVARHRRLLEKSKKTEEMLNELRVREKSKRHHADSELERLQEKLRTLQQENLTLIDSRDHAEELCEKREAEALRDMTELRRLTKDLVEEERGKVRQIREDYISLKEEADAHVEELLQQHDEDLRSKDEELAVLRRQLEKLTSKKILRFHDETGETDSADYSYSETQTRTSTSDTNASSSSSSSSPAPHNRERSSRKHRSRDGSKHKADDAVSSATARRLERENDELLAEVEELEARTEAIEEENRRLTRLVKDYESGDEGLLHMRHELSDALRTVEVLQDENAQLRERLNGMEDSLAFTAALRELCKRMGVTEEEINSLKPQNVAAYSEMDTLKEELNVLKEEVEWLERERRHWMNKVRLQPLLDTKLRFELGLTSEQLRQLDNLVDQMKAGNLVVEDEDKTYKEKYFEALEARRKDAAQFNEYVRDRIEEALKSAFSSETGAAIGNEDGTVSALTALKDHIDLLTANANASGSGSGTARAAGTGSGDGVVGLINTPAELTRRQLKEQLESTKRQVSELQLTANDNAEATAQLREKLSSAKAEVDMLTKERDQYRDAIFAAAGAHSAAAGQREPYEEGQGLASDADAAAASAVSASALLGDLGDGGGGGGGGGSVGGGSTTGNVALSKERLLGFQSKWASIAATLREQLKAKDEVIDTLNARVSALQDTLESKQGDAAKHREAVETERRAQEALQDQLAALHELNEELDAKNRELLSTNTDLEKGLQGLDDSSKTKELLQKVVLLRRREAKLMSRLRRAIGAQQEADAAAKKMRGTVDHTLTSLREALEGSSTGFVLPPSAATHSLEEEQLNHLHTSVSRLLSGKLFREDSRYLLHLQQVYHSMETSEEAMALRLREKDHLKKIDTLQAQVDELQTAAVELQQQQQQRAATTDDEGGATGSAAKAAASSPHSVASAAKWESESVMWRQKYELWYKRLEAKDGEVALLEKELDTARQEIVDVKDHVRNILSTSATGNEDTRPSSSGDARSSNSAGRLTRYEREVARLKSINLGLLQHTLDLQGNAKALEVDLEAKSQELALLKDAGNADVINDFVSAAVREHAALRRQSELALIQARRMKIQLAATEANFQVVANEATAYKLSAYRLYRRYVEEMVGVVDYVRCLQRMSKGALSAHRAEIMDQRFRRLAEELDRAMYRNHNVVADLADRTSAMATLEQQLKLSRMERGSSERADAMEARLREARVAVREAAREMAECKEDERHTEGKVRRLEAYVKQLTDEVTRLEFGALTGGAASPLNESLLQSLQHLKDTVFAKAEAPPLALAGPTGGSSSGRDGAAATAGLYRAGVGFTTAVGVAGDDADADTAVREYKAAVVKQRELASQVVAQQQELGVKTKEAERLRAVIEDQKDMLRRLEEKTTFYQKQLDEDRGKADQREARLKRAHETQAEVSRRAMEHNAQCLREMMQKKETEIAQLREQLNVERRRYMEQQLEEASRMERVHEGMFRENNAMVERFKVAIDSVGDRLLAIKPPLPGGEANGSAASSSSSAMLEQLRYLTSETIRLQKELEAVRATNIVLESQLTQQINAAQRSLIPTAATANVPSAAPLFPTTTTTAFPSGNTGSYSIVSGPAHPPPAAASSSLPPAFIPGQNTPSQLPAAAPITTATGESTGVNANTSSSSGGGGGMDALTSIIKSQSAMIESLRQREAAISHELLLEKQHHGEAEKALQELQLRLIEKEGAVQLVSQATAAVNEPASARELKAQLAFVEQELQTARVQLEQERTAARQLQTDASAWKAHLDHLQLQVANQQVEVDRARHLAMLNEGMQGDLNALKDQNDKLMIASSLLKQKLLDEARKGGESARQHQHEIALAQRMGSLQQESSEQMRVLDRRIKEVQRELNARVAAEKEMLGRNEETQRLVYQLHQQLRAKDREIADLKSGSGGGGSRRASPTRPSQQPRRRDDKGTQMLSTVPPHEQPGAHVVDVRGEATPPPPPAHQQQQAAQPRTPPPAENRGDEEDVDRHQQSQQPQSQEPQRAPVAMALTREVQRMQRDNLQQISLLRSTVGRLEKDLDEAREQLKGEREAAKLLRGQLHSAKRAAEEAEAQHARELVEAHRRRAAAESEAAAAARAPARRSAQPLSDTTSIAALEAKAALADRLQQELLELRGTQSGAPTAGAPASATASALDIRSHVRTVQNLESVIDELRRQLNVVAPTRANELQRRNSELQSAVDRLLADLAATRGRPVDELRHQYSVTSVTAVHQSQFQQQQEGARTVTQLENELLARNNTILDLRFTQETLELRVGRLQRHLDDLMAADANHHQQQQRQKSLRTSTEQQRGGSARTHQDQVESLEAVIGNLQLIVHALQKENAELKTQTAFSARYPEMSREVRQLRKREKELQTNLSQLMARMATVQSRDGVHRRMTTTATTTTNNTQQQQQDRAARLQERLVGAQASAEAYHAELEALRATLEGQLAHQQQQQQLQPPSSFPVGQVGGPANLRGVRPLGEDGSLPRLDSASGRARGPNETEADVPPPLPPAPFAVTVDVSGGPAVGARGGSTVQGPHAHMRHHHLSRR